MSDDLPEPAACEHGEPAPAAETVLRRHCKVYLATFRAQRERGIHPFYAHRRAEAVASEQFRLLPQERKRRDEEWLDKGPEFKGWRVEAPEDKGVSLFDVPHAE